MRDSRLAIDGRKCNDQKEVPVAQAIDQVKVQVERDKRPRLIEISVNRKPVKVAGPKQTGLTIKQAAIEQGVKIEVTFQLSELLGGHQTKIVGDSDPVTVHKGSAFLAVAGDDNS